MNLPSCAILAIVVPYGFFAAMAQERSAMPLPYEEHLASAEMLRNDSRRGVEGLTSLASDWFHAIHYTLDLSVQTAPVSLQGVITIRGKCNLNHPKFLTLDLMNTMRVDSVIVEGVAASVVQQPSAFTISLDSSIRSGDIITLNVHYKGVPFPTGLGSFISTSHSGVPWIWTLSEPYGARDWWPCKDQPGDKADSVDVIVTADSSFTVGSNGVLISEVQNPGGTKTTHWKERYPIATYLVSVTMTNFVRFSNWFHYSPTESLEIRNYVLPESLSTAFARLPRAVDGMAIFSDIFGFYPFVKEKYGHCQFGQGGMEHQTMTSIGDFSEETVIHELAHQWFGDMISCRSWSHLWLNEGFATYCTALYEEKKYGLEAYRRFMESRFDPARSAIGSVFAADTADVHELFDFRRVYSKGASVLHMLRHVLGDSVFFQAMYAYANHPSLKYKSASTEDFQRICEQTSGKGLQYFFDEWIYGENYPRYTYAWDVKDSAGGSVLNVTVNQSTGTTNPRFFTMPIDLRIVGGGSDTTLTVLNTSSSQTFNITVPFRPDTLQFDPEEWILKSALDISSFPLPIRSSLSQNYPNPFNNSTVIRYDLAHRARVTVSIVNTIGQRIATLFSGDQIAGRFEIRWYPTDLASGLYFCRLEGVNTGNPYDAFVLLRKMLLIR